MALKIVAPVDYTVFSHPSVMESKKIDIEDDLPLYHTEAHNLGLEVTPESEVVVASAIVNQRKIVAVPGVGLLGGGYGDGKMLMCPPSLISFHSFHCAPYFFAPVFCGRKFFFAGDSVRVNDGTRVVVLQPRVIGNLKYYVVPSNYKNVCVELDGCVCFNSVPHFHMLKVVASKKTIWLNLVAHTKRTNGGKCTRKQLFAEYVGACGSNSIEVQARYASMERVNEVEFGIGDGVYKEVT